MLRPQCGRKHIEAAMTHARPPQYSHFQFDRKRQARGLDAVTLAVVRLMMTLQLPMVLDRRVAVLPVVSIVAAIGVRIARSQVLAICVRVELRAIAGI